jgi:hypothetical protein
LRPRYQHYYFGDYYAVGYGRAGFYPAYAVNSGRFGYDPIFAYNRWQHRQDRGWDQRVAADFLNRRTREDLRPPRTWAAQRQIDIRSAQARQRGFVVAAPLDDLRRGQHGPMQFQPVNQAERQRLAQQAQDVQRFRQQRQTLEANAVGGPAGPVARTFAPARVRLPGSPIMAQSAVELGKNHAPPKVYDTPKVDTRVVVKSNLNRSLEQPKQHTVNRVPLDQPRKQLQPPPKVERAPQPQHQPTVKQVAPPAQPKVVRQTPPPQPKAKQPAPPPRGKDPAGQPPAGSNQDQNKGKDKK